MMGAIIAIDKTTLKSASALLHDARFSADELIWEPETDQFRMNCWVLGSLKQPGESRMHRWDGWVLTFFNVTSCKIDIHERVIYYELADISFDEQRKILTLITQYAISITLSVADLSGNLVATGESKAF